jgi:quercetin dioxygenase-like cupin family protein
MRKLEVAHIDTCPVHHLPGRDWFYLLGPLNSEASNLAFGLVEFPEGTLAPAQTHPHEEEVIYVLAGEGAVISHGEEIQLSPGVGILIPPGVPHQIRAGGEQSLTLVTVFSPPADLDVDGPGKD